MTSEAGGGERGGERIDFVQALRGIAALAVVMFHARIWIVGPAYLDIGNRLFENGAAGVDLFFVVSGFIMVHTTWDSPGGVRGAARFFAKRFARIWPPYVLATMGLLVAEWTFLKFLTRHDGQVALAKAFTFYPQIGTRAPFFGWTPNGVGWTLNYEMWFYVLFAIAMFFGRRQRLLVLAALMGLFLVGIPFAFTGHVHIDAYADYNMSPAILNLAANSMVWEFLAGAAIAVIYRSRFRIRNRDLRATFVAVTVTFVLWQQFSNDMNRQGMTGWGPAMILMMLALALWNKESPIKVPRGLRWLGDISFSLYLVHRIAQIGLLRLIPDSHHSLAGGFGYVMATTVLALLLAHFSFKYIEQGLSEHLRKWLLRRIG